MITETLPASQIERLLAARESWTQPPQVVSDTSIFHLLAMAGREKLATLMTEQHYARGEIVFKEGEVGDAMYIIRSGQVVVLKGDLKAPTILGYWGAGEIIGEIALLEDQPRSASVIALDETNLLKINREDFQQFMNHHAAIGMSISESLIARLRAADEARGSSSGLEKRLAEQISTLQTEKERLEALQNLRQETMDLIVHDLRSPLSLISAAVNMIKMMLPAEAVRENEELFEIATSNCELMTRLVDSLLGVARLESGQDELQLAETNLSALIQKVLNRTPPLLKQDITIHYAAPTNLPPVRVDVEKIDRVLANLIDNALKYTPKNGRVTLNVQAQDEQIWVSITNTGLTIPAKDRKRIFERFAQVAGRVRPRGFGLGLAFCRLAVEAHGGRIWVEPGEGDTGNRFVFTLPLLAGHA